jgi:hypothetical protein
MLSGTSQFEVTVSLTYPSGISMPQVNAEPSFYNTPLHAMAVPSPGGA